MSTTPTPAPDGSKTIEVTRNIFDLDSKGEVRVGKSGIFKPVNDMNEFVTRLGNDSKKILSIVNDGLEEYAKRELANDGRPWFELTEEDEIKTDASGDPVEFSGTPLPEEKTKSFNATILNMAKSMFGFPDGRLPKGTPKSEVEENRKRKLAARQAALDMVLSNPAAVEALKR